MADHQHRLSGTPPVQFVQQPAFGRAIQVLRWFVEQHHGCIRQQDSRESQAPLFAGRHARPAFAEHDPEGETVGSISNERTFREDVTDPASIEAVLCGLCERVCWRARKRHVMARTVSLKLRYADFHTLTRSHTTAATSSELELYPIVKEMFAAARTRPMPIRLLGIQLSSLGMFEQLPLFDRNERVGAAVDSIRARFGFATVSLATAQRPGAKE